MWRLIAYPWLTWGGYAALSYVYRFLWERKYRDVPVNTFSSMSDLVKVLGGGTAWRADSWRALGDAFAYPGKVQKVLQKEEPQPTHDLDCDDFAIFTATAIEASRIAHPTGWMGIFRARILTVTWLDGGFISGHNVVLLTVDDPEGTESAYCYMDYGNPSKRVGNIDAVAELVREKYHKKTKEPIVWLVSDLTLKPWLSKWG